MNINLLIDLLHLPQITSNMNHECHNILDFKAGKKMSYICYTIKDRFSLTVGKKERESSANYLWLSTQTQSHMIQPFQL